MHWIRKYGQHLLRLHVTDNTDCPVAEAIEHHDDKHVGYDPDPPQPFVWRDLPCPQLQQFTLELDSWMYHMSVSAGPSLGLHAAASSLTSLQLSRCSVEGPGGWDSTVALQGLRSLQHLKLIQMALSPKTLQLPCLAQLKRLQLLNTGPHGLSSLR
jgi:hypothetical protein